MSDGTMIYYSGILFGFMFGFTLGLIFAWVLESHRTKEVKNR